MTIAIDDPVALDAAAGRLRSQASTYEDLGTLLRGLRTDDWSGAAAEAFRASFGAEPRRWFDAADTLLTAANALAAHADVTRWARDRMHEARLLEDRAAVASSPDAAVRMTEQAHALASDACSELADSSWRTSARLDAAAAAAPTARRWDDEPWWDVAWHAVANAGVDVVNALASTGTAIQHHPGAAAGLIGGALLADLGAGIGAGSIALDVTGVGALVGLPAGALAAGLISTGTVLAGGSAADLLMHAVTDDARTPLEKLPNDATRVSGTDTTWADPRTLPDHFARHGPDFGLSSAEEYARAAADFLNRGRSGELPMKIDSDGTMRVYDAANNVFGSYTPRGLARTFYKPTSPTYWTRQPGVLQ